MQECEPAGIAPDPQPRPRPVPEDALTGRVVIVLERFVPAGRASDLLEHAGDNADLLGALRTFLVENKVGSTGRVVTNVDVDELERRAGRRRRKDVAGLARFWRIDVRGTGRSPQEVVDLLLGLRFPGIAHAYAETTAADPAQITAADEPENPRQGYVEQRPDGVDARWAWGRVGGGGEGIGFADLEQGWFTAHEDLAGRVGGLLCHLNLFDVTGEGDHGTGVLGVVLGSDNARGGLGIAPGLARVSVCSHYDGTGVPKVADAIAVATGALSAGDVLLLEVERPGGYPTETDDADFAAVVDATEKGIIVVEAAGNGAQNLDTWRSTAGRALDRDVDDLDSGAVVVAAARRRVEQDGPDRGHRWLLSSSYGRRVDCYAWGEAVATADVAGYRQDFGGTSAAAAIVAGAAAALQGMVRAATGGVLTPEEMRRRLSDPRGTPQIPAASRALVPIGVLPDLKILGEDIGAQPRPPG